MSDDPSLQGAINHVLRTAFKDVYSKAQSGIPSTKTRAKQQKEDAQVTRPSPDGAGVLAEGEPQQGGGDGDDDGVMEEVPEVELEEAAQLRLRQIDASLGVRQSQASAIMAYLGRQLQQAKEEDEEDSCQLKREGLLVKAHIPIGPSHLHIDPGVIRTFGTYGDNLLSAHYLIEANRDKLLRRSGRLPVADGLRTYSLAQLLHVEPHYYIMTGSLLNRKNITLQHSTAIHGALSPLRRRQTQQHEDDDMSSSLADGSSSYYNNHDHHGREEEEEGGEEEESSALLEQQRKSSNTNNTNRQPSKGVGANLEQRSLDDVMTARMASKLHYLRNPRYQKHERAYRRSLVSRVQEDEVGYLTPPLPQGYPHHFSCAPSPLVFYEYEVGKPYQAQIAIRNVTGLKRSFRLLPPSTPFYTVVDLAFPTPGDRDLAPGIAAVLTIRFVPDSLSTYDDCLTVVCESGAIPVPLLSQRLRPSLSLPDVLDVGMCLIGDYIPTKIRVTNRGGAGRFRLLEERDYPFPRQAQALMPVLRLPPFKAWPTEFALAPGQAMDLHVTFVPTTPGRHSVRFLLLCDDCTVREMVLTGETGSIELGVQELGGVPLEGEGYDAIACSGDLNHMDLGVVPVGGRASATQTFTLANRCDTPLAFRWQWVAAASSPPPFSMSPWRGTLGPRGICQFTVEYRPGGPTTETAQLAFLLEGVPPSALPLPGQEGQLAALEARGRGGLFRLENWERRQQQQADGGMVTRQELEEGGLLAPLLTEEAGHLRYETMEALDVLFMMTGATAVPVSDVLSSLSPAAKAVLEVALEADPAVSEEPEPKADVECLRFALAGAGTPLDVVLASLPVIQVAGPLDVGGQPLQVTVTLENRSAAPAAFEWAAPRLLPSTAHDEPTLRPSAFPPPVPLGQWASTGGSSSFDLSLSPPSGVIPPTSRLDVVLTLTPHATGPLHLHLPCLVPGCAAPPRLSLHAVVQPPRVRFVEPEVDFGLLAVEGQTKRTLSFVNQSSAPLHWNLIQDPTGLETVEVMETYRQMQLLAATAASATGRGSFSSARSGRSSISRATTEDSTMAKGLVSGVVFEPETGELAPGAKATVTITLLGGRLSERIRGRLCCQVRDLMGRSPANEQYITYRGEVQELKVFLDQLHLDLGVCYVDVPVTRTITMTNVSNLTTAFKFERPLEGSKNFGITITPEAGKLTEKEVIKVEVRFVVRAPGVADELFGCRVSGMTHPLGFTLKAVGKGVVVAYELLNDNQAVPRPLADPTEPQLPAGVVIPSADALPMLQFGNVPLFARRRLRFAIRNLSAVPAAFKLQPRRFPAHHGPIEKKRIIKAAKDGCSLSDTAASGKSISCSFSSVTEQQPPFTKPTSSTPPPQQQQAGPEEEEEGEDEWGEEEGGLGRVQRGRVDEKREKMGRFKSGPGKTYLTAKYEKEEDKVLLSAGNGLAMDVRPSRGVLVPWGVTEVVVDAYNNMSGTYSDELQAAIRGAPPASLGVKMAVHGCPLSLRQECVGLDYHGTRTNSSGSSSSGLGGGAGGALPTLHFGEVCRGDGPHTKTITIKNNGPVDALLAWKVLAPETRSDHAPLASLKIALLAPEQDEWVDDDEDGNEGATPTLTAAGGDQAVAPPQEGGQEEEEEEETPRPRRRRRVRPSGPLVQLSIESVEPRADPVWSISAPATTNSNSRAVRGFREATFRVTMRSTPTDPLGPTSARLVLDAEWQYSKAQMARVKDGAKQRTGSAIRLLATATVIDPVLSLDKRHHHSSRVSEEEGGSDDDEGSSSNSKGQQFLKYEVSALDVRQAQRRPQGVVRQLPPSMHRSFALTNPTTVPLHFALHVPPPFKALSVQHNYAVAARESKHPHKQQHIQDGARFTLGPHESLNLDVAFLPPRDAAATSTATLAATFTDKLRVETKAALDIAFATGQHQLIHLRGIVLRPLVVVAPCEHSYGTVHVESSASILLFLCNPTVIPATWRVSYVPPPPTKAKTNRLRRSSIVQPWADPREVVPGDDPSVFQFQETEGVQPGPSLPLTSSAAILPEDYNRDSPNAVFPPLPTHVSWLQQLTTLEKLQVDNKDRPAHRFSRPIEVVFRPKQAVQYRSRFRFEVEAGEGFDVVLTGAGTYEEDTKPAPPPHI